MHCKCAVCENARKIGGKEIKARMGVLIDDDLLIDFSPDMFFFAMKYRIDFDKIKNICITHSHGDHLNLQNLMPCVLLGDEDKNPIWNIYSNATVNENIKKGIIIDNLSLTTVEFEKEYKIGEYKVVPLPATHTQTENCLLFLIEKEGKRYLHLSDTGELKKEVYDYLSKNKITVDAVAIDCTYGLVGRDYYGHMNLSQVVKATNKLRDLGVILPTTEVYLTHLCHWGGSHREVESRANQYGIKVAYDGMEIVL
jgi:phosphoribosyl 1,2-cyclic phosphate phosphodiesterase